MQISLPHSAEHLLRLFTIEVSPGAWCLVALEFCEASSATEIAETATAIAALSETADSNNDFSNALIEIGCYYWPGEGVTYGAWLKEVATLLTVEAERKANRSRKLPPVFSPKDGSKGHKSHG